MKAKRIQLSRKAGWRKPEGAVVCSRPGRWGTPFRVVSTYMGKALLFAEIVRDGSIVNRYDSVAEATRCAVGFFSAWLMTNGPFGAVRRELRGKDLCCWCKLCPRHAQGRPWDEQCDDCAPCHVDILLAVAQGDQ